MEGLGGNGVELIQAQFQGERIGLVMKPGDAQVRTTLKRKKKTKNMTLKIMEKTLTATNYYYIVKTHIFSITASSQTAGLGHTLSYNKSGQPQCNQ